MNTQRNSRRRIPLQACSILCLFSVVLCMTDSGRQAFARVINALSNFQGANPGVPIAFQTISLPSVTGPHVPSGVGIQQRAFETNIVADTGLLNATKSKDHPFSPEFDELTSGNIIITNRAQLRMIWELLFNEPFNPQLVDFDNEFVVMMGGGQMHPFFGFDITSVEQFDAMFMDQFFINYTESGLAIVAATFLPGPPPPMMDPEFKVTAVSISRDFLNEIIFSRQVFVAP